MKLLFTEIEPKEETLLKQAFPDDIVYCSSGKLSPELIKKFADSQILSVFIDSHITKEVLEQLPNLQMIITRSTGYDHIDTQAAAQRGIVVCNAPYYATTAVAEYTFALILALARIIYTTCYQVKHKHVCKPKELRGFELKGKTIGIIGLGSIGKEVAQLAHAFGMKIIVYDIHQDKKFAQQWDITFCTLPDLLANSDIITLHIPLTKQTYHLINTQSIQQIKHGAYIINTARGALIDNKALLTAIEKGIVAGAALDVMDERQSKEAQQLIDNACVLVTPHNAYNTAESKERLLQDSIATIKAWQDGKPIHVISN